METCIKITHVFETWSSEHFGFTKVVRDSNGIDLLPLAGVHHINVSMINKVNAISFRIIMIFVAPLELSKGLLKGLLHFFY
jgi:hypothetical protein